MIEEVYQRGIPVVLIDRKIESDQYTAYVGGDNYEIGHVAGLYISNKLGNKGEIVEVLGGFKYFSGFRPDARFSKSDATFAGNKNCRSNLCELE